MNLLIRRTILLLCLLIFITLFGKPVLAQEEIACGDSPKPDCCSATFLKTYFGDEAGNAAKICERASEGSPFASTVSGPKKKDCLQRGEEFGIGLFLINIYKTGLAPGVFEEDGPPCVIADKNKLNEIGQKLLGPATNAATAAQLYNNNVKAGRDGWSWSSVARELGIQGTVKSVPGGDGIVKGDESGIREEAVAPSAPPTKEEKREKIQVDIASQIGNLYNWAVGIGGLVALGVLIFGGVLYATSSGNISRQDEAKNWLFGAVIGILILFSSYVILSTINPELTKLKDFELLVNEAAQSVLFSSLSDGEGLGGGSSSPYSIIDGQTCPLAPGFSYGEGCGAGRPGFEGGHEGVDLMAKLGSPLYAIEDGVIDGGWGWNWYGGWRFWLYADSGNKYYYAHTLSREKLPPAGKRFRAGEPIGFVGESGNGLEGTYGKVGGPHLHLQLQTNKGGAVCGDPAHHNVDPVPLVKTICNPDYISSGETTSNPALVQVLNQSPYNQFGVVFTELGGQSASVGEKTTFPIASLYKLFVAQNLYELRSQGKLNFDDKIVRLVDVARQLVENSADGTPGSIWSPSPEEGQLVSVNDCLPKMIKYSDNVCGKALRNFVEDKGYNPPSGLSEMSANDIAKVLTSIVGSASQELYNLMRQQYHGDKIPKKIKDIPGVAVANKTGELHPGSSKLVSHDAAIIKYEGKTYVLVIMTGRNPDNPSTNQPIQNLASELLNALKK